MLGQAVIPDYTSPKIMRFCVLAYFLANYALYDNYIMALAC
jgi:hypothetical protein